MYARHSMSIRLATFVVPFTLAASVEGQCWLDTIARGQDTFGSTIAVSGDVALIGQPAAGVTHVYRWTGSAWAHDAVLRPAEIAEGDWFGGPAAISGAVVVIGNQWIACSDGPSCGAAFVFRFDGTEWRKEATLTRSVRNANDRFGASVAVDGDVVVVGVPGAQTASGRCGEVHIFRFQDGVWALDQRITPITGSCALGWDVSIDGDAVLIGAKDSDILEPWVRRAGSAFVLRHDGTSWTFEQRLFASDAAFNDEFGASVAMHGDRAVVGAPGDDWADRSNCGAAYVFRRWDDGTWIQEAKLTRPVGGAGDHAGTDVAIREGLVVVSAPNFDVGVPIHHDVGVIDVFEYDGAGWVLRESITGPLGRPVPPLFEFWAAPHFGRVVALRGQVVLSSASDFGYVYTYAVIGSDCNENDTLDVCEGLAAPSFVEQRPACDCVPASSPAFGPTAVASNRFLSIEPGSAGRITALRVTVEALDPPHDALNGQTRWVGEPFEVTESSSAVDPADAPGAATFFAATLQCEPFYTDWSGYGTVHVLHPLIIPNGTYTVQAIDGQCPLASELDYSTPLELTETRWGDAVGHCATIPCTPPNENVQILDAVAILQKFVNAPGAIAKYRADLDPGTPDLTISISDVLAALTGFQGLPYPFSPEEGIPCG